MDAIPVIDYFAEMYPLRSLSIFQLTEKAILLLVSSTVQRPQTFALIKIENIIENIIENKNAIVIKIPADIKTSALGQHQPLLVLASL